MDAGNPVLAVRDLSVRYGKTRALDRISLDVQEGEVIALLGGNGAGKTTLLNTISGFLQPVGGSIEYRGQPIAGLPPHATFRRGIAQISQARDLFTEMSVEDNLLLGAALRTDDVTAALHRVFGYFPRLQERRNQRVQTQSGGEQQMVAIARALMGEPRLLMFDEPSGGLSPHFVGEIGRIIARLKADGITMLVVEQNIGLALAVADRFYVLRDGSIMRSGAAGEIDARSKHLAAEFYL